MTQSKKSYYKKMFNMEVDDFLKIAEKSEVSFHCYLERENRIHDIDENALPVEGFIAVVDKKHKNGYEVHALYDDGTIRIFNYKSGKLITILFARIAQFKRMADKKTNGILPDEIFQKILKNLREGKNYN